ncbi:hypothetical protein ACFPVX_21955 [Cohnella faecalis]|uniref:Uncharacterized protein n=1 Tax=Cohnella faecalis TaxID=2315694 RepID=A0A398CKK6_9BACL|nr:hypothetical protein [Cohnella faecalis]RIE00427.1 hypothetical protein D3H35_28885 [Cohnella faecalis]
MKKIKLTLFVALCVSLLPAVGVSAEKKSANEIERGLAEIINEELNYNGYSSLSTSDFNKSDADFDQLITEKKVDSKIKDRIKKLKNAEYVSLTFDEDGILTEAQSNKSGNVVERFKHENPNKNKVSNKNEVRISSLLTDTSPKPVGASSGAFHRIKTPESTSLSASFTGAVADGIVLPTVDINNSYLTGESSNLYIGIDSATNGYAEVGLVTAKSLSLAAGWYPGFHAKGTHTLNSGHNSNSGGGYYYDVNRPMTPGTDIGFFKVYYKYDEATLRVRYLLGATTVYDVSFTGVNSTGKSVKRLTTIAMNSSATDTTKFSNSWTSYASWKNFRFLTNNGSSTTYWETVTGIKSETWSHGGSIDYTKSGTTESYKIY